jgi:catalase
MSEQDRKDLHYNTAITLKLVDFPVIQENYLAQVYNIELGYAKAVYDLLDKGFGFSVVQEKAKKFRPFSQNRVRMGSVPGMQTYNIRQAARVLV